MLRFIGLTLQDTAPLTTGAAPFIECGRCGHERFNSTRVRGSVVRFVGYSVVFFLVNGIALPVGFPEVVERFKSPPSIFFNILYRDERQIETLS
jgi:hypothetical protein